MFRSELSGCLLLQVGAEIVRRALCYPLKLIAKNAGVNGSVVVEKVGALVHCFSFDCKHARGDRICISNHLGCGNGKSGRLIS